MIRAISTMEAMEIAKMEVLAGSMNSVPMCRAPSPIDEALVVLCRMVCYNI